MISWSLCGHGEWCGGGGSGDGGGSDIQDTLIEDTMTMDTVPLQCSGKPEQSVDEKQASGPPTEAISGTPEQDAISGKPEQAATAATPQPEVPAGQPNPEANSGPPEGPQQDSIVAAGDAASSEVAVATARCSFCGDMYRTSAMKVSGKAKAGAEAKYRCKACACTDMVLA